MITTDKRYQGRSSKQPYRWFCCNPNCWENGERYEFVREKDTCPKCGASGYPYVVLLALIHFMLADPQGEILSMGLRYRLACDPLRRRAHLATKSNNEAATGEPSAVTCPGCKKEIEKQKILTAPSGRLILGDES